jgi:hypothetical protein
MADENTGVADARARSLVEDEVSNLEAAAPPHPAVSVFSGKPVLL